jgi:hypothetical protein
LSRPVRRSGRHRGSGTSDFSGEAAGNGPPLADWARLGLTITARLSALPRRFTAADQRHRPGHDRRDAPGRDSRPGAGCRWRGTRRRDAPALRSAVAVAVGHAHHIRHGETQAEGDHQGHPQAGVDSTKAKTRLAAQEDEVLRLVNVEGRTAGCGTVNCSVKAIGVGAAKGVDGTIGWGRLFGLS